MGPEKGSRAGERSGAQALLEVAEGAGGVQPGEKKAQEGPLSLSTTP